MTEVGSVDVVIRGRSDTLQSDLQMARRHLDNFDRSAVRTARGAQTLSAANDNLARSVQGATGLISRMPGPIGVVGAHAGVLATGVLGVTTAIVGLASVISVKAVAAFQELELEQTTYNAVLKATGYAAGKTSEDIEELAVSIRKAGTETEGAVRGAAAKLLTFRSVSGETFDEALRLSQDLAAVGFGSIESAALMVGKALEDPTRGILALRRAGVSFSEVQKQQIKNFLETGQAAKAQQLVLDGIARQVGGAGAARGATLTGAYNQLSEATNNWFELIGSKLVKATSLNEVLRGMAGNIEAVNSAMEKAATPQGQLDAIDAEIARRKSQSSFRSWLSWGTAAVPGAPGMPGQATNALLKERERLLAEVARRQQEVDSTMDTAELGRMSAETAKYNDAVAGTGAQLAEERKQLQMTAVQREIDVALKKAQTDAGAPLTEAAKADIAAQVRANFYLKEGAQLLQTRVSLLGEAASVELRVAAANRQTTEALKQGVSLSREEIALIQQRNVLKANEASISERSPYGLVSSIELAAQKQREFDLVTRQYNLSAQEQLVLATALDKKYRELGDSVAVAGSRFPELTRAALDATNVGKQLDQFLVTSLNNTASALTDVVMGTKTTKEAFAALAQSVLRDLAQMIIKAQLFAVVSSFTGGSSGGIARLFGSAQGNVFQQGQITPFARGGIVDRPIVFPMANGVGLMGEAGPEAVMPLRRGPGGRLGVEASGGGGSVYQDNRVFNIDARGATADGIALLNRKIDALRAESPQIALAAVHNAHSKRPSVVRARG